MTIIRQLLALVMCVTLGWGQSGVFEPQMIKQAGATTGQSLLWDGSKWAPGNPSAAGVSSVDGLTGALTFTDDTNVIVTGSGTVLTVGWTGTLAKVRQPATNVHTDQANTYTTGAQDFGSATSLKVPVAAGAAPATNGLIAYDSTSNTLESAINGVNKTIAMTDSSITGNAATATALAANGANCSSGNAPLGVDASGASESCFDVATQAELDTHEALTAPHSATASNTASRIVLRGASGEFAAGAITGSLVGNASTATALAANGANCSGNNFALGVDASGVGECAQPAFSNLSGAAVDSQIPDTITITLAATATALAANGANCSAGSFPLGVDASGASETCTALPTTIAGTANEITASASTGAITLSLPSEVVLTSKALVLPNSNTLPATCTRGSIYIDNDATSGSRLYICESTNTWVVISGGGGGGGSINGSGTSNKLAKFTASTTIGDATIGDDGTIVTLTVALGRTADISPTQLSANQNDYNPSSLSTSSVLRLTSDASRNITGLQGGSDGRILTLINVGSFDIVLISESSSSTAAYRFGIPYDMTLVAGDAVSIIYDSTSSRWRRMDSGTYGVASGLVVSGGKLAADTATILSRATDQAGTDRYLAPTGGSDTYTYCPTPALTALPTAGSLWILNPDVNNTGAATINICAQGAIALKVMSSGAKADPATDEIDLDGLYLMMYDGVDMVVSRLDQAASATIAFSAVTAGTNTAALVSTGSFDISGGTLTITVGAGAAPTANGRIAYDSTANQYEGGVNGSNKIFAMTDGNVATATALASNPSDCSATQFATTIAASGNLTCATPAFTDISGIATPAQLSATVNASTGTTYTVVNGDRGKLITLSNASSVAVTLPQAGGGGSFISGWFADFQNLGVGTVTITPTTSTVDGAASITLVTNQGVRIFSDGTNYSTQRGRHNISTSAILAAAINDETGTGVLVLATNPTLVTPVLGVATATSINGLTITTSTGTLTITNGKTFSVTGTLTLAGTDGTTMTFPAASGAVMTADSTSTQTEKTINAESSGNVITLPFKISIPAANCQNATAFSGWAYGTSSFPSFSCVTGSNTVYGVAAFDADADEFIQTSFDLPSDFTGAIDLDAKWRAAATTGATSWGWQTACVADAETGDPAWNTAQYVSDTTKGTTLQFNDIATQTSITITGCAASERFFFRFFRDGDGSGATDDMTGDAQLISVRLTLRRAM